MSTLRDAPGLEPAAAGAWLADQLRRGYDGDPWHGSSLTRILAGLDAGAAGARPLPAAHCIWAIVLHITAWTREVTRRLGGAPPAQPAEGDWPEVGASTSERWQAALAGLSEAHFELERAVRALPPEQWREIVGSERDAATGTGVTKAQLVIGLVQHDAYHAGQIALIRKGVLPVTAGAA